ncbi:uncharacterized protein [Physcomitrium patens]|uniref:uncharacterized protein n=1 Tax=Physcomitrium patens TaxID=3218 RepID=UPI000D1573D9|nr:uncharacterized protein LOC112293576 [Physcomitrium patens]|eukprot:XP_024398940.1 uncharacterized protein LOC112293576 [Physcomitrella patens]
MQEAAIREWVLLTAEERSNLRTYYLYYVMARADVPEAYVQMKVLSVAAVLLKRGWYVELNLIQVARVDATFCSVHPSFVELMSWSLLPQKKESFFNEARHAVLGAHGPAAQ